LTLASSPGSAPRRPGICDETPSGLAIQPFAQLGQMPPDQDQRLAVGAGDQQRLGEQGAQRGPALRLFLGRDYDALMRQGP
jgi:hypothetical protein